jgi:XTP/dITP diphosphohydrolase
MYLMKLVVASRNQGKLKEIKAILEPLSIEVVSLDAFPSVPEVVEDGATFAENAVKKAKTIADITGYVTLADDSGLEVDYLNGEPGVYSARYAGQDQNDLANNEKLLQKLKDIPREKRSARFRCVVAVALPGGPSYTAEGVCEGVITTRPVGEKGFGYDPLFLVPSLGETLAEMDPAVKNKISHRAQALFKMKEILATLASEMSQGSMS